MRKAIFVLSMLLCLVTVSICWTSAETRAQSPTTHYGPAEQLLVLKNGDFLRGRITRNVEQVIVHRSNGSTSVLPAEQTEFVCDSLDDAYWEKVARLKATDTDGQIDLFHWCLKYRLLDHAQNQIVILLELGAKASDLENLDRQLTVALMQERSAASRETKLAIQKLQLASPPASREPTSNGLKPIEFSQTIGVDSLIGRKSSTPDVFDSSDFRSLPSFDENTSPDSQFAMLPLISSERTSDSTPDTLEIESTIDPIRQVGYDELVYDTISPKNRMRSAASIEMEKDSVPPPLDQVDDRIMNPIHELQRELKALPKGAVGMYRTRVERALAFGCSAAKCHDSSSRIMPIMQISKTQAIPRMQSQRNLHNVLKYVDRERPFESRLYKAAMQPHAGQTEPILELFRAENLTKWLIMLADDPPSALQDAIRIEQERLGIVQTGSRLQDGNSLNSHPTERQTLQPVSVPTRDSLADSQSANPIVPAKPKRAGLSPLHGSDLRFPDTIVEIPKLDSNKKRFTPLDPFDPEIFNRRFRR